MEIDFMNCLMEELGVSFDNITTSAVCRYPLPVVGPNLFIASKFESVMVARASLAPDPAFFSTNWSRKALEYRETKETCYCFT